MTPFELFLFSTDPDAVSRHARAGVDGFIVDWERLGKETRQAGADTEINADTPADLRRVRASTKARVVCRVNPHGPWTGAEVEDAVAGGADEILVPMVRSPDEVSDVIALVAGRCGVGILVETVGAVRCAKELARLPISRVYVGLNDLSIERRSRSIFEALTDGLVDGIRPLFPMPFGLAGLTLPESGRPIPCRLLVGEMARLSCSFSFLRRSWRRDTAGHEPSPGIARIRSAIESAGRRSAAEIARDRAEFVETVAAPPGTDAVLAAWTGRYEGRGRLATSRVFKILREKLTGYPRDAGMFFALRRPLVEEILRHDVPHPFLPSLVGLSGRRFVTVGVERAARPGGGSAYSGTARLLRAAREIAFIFRRRRAC